MFWPFRRRRAVPGPAPLDAAAIVRRARRLRFRVRPGAVSQLAGAYHGARPGIGLTFARVLRAFRQALWEYRHCLSPSIPLRELLSSALIDRYARRDKRSRDYPRKKYDPPAKPPRITTSTVQQRQRAQQLGSTNSSKGLTA